MSSGAGAPKAGAKAPPKSGSRGTTSGAPTEHEAIPAPDEYPRAPKKDLVTVRVKEVNTENRFANYFCARAFETGVEIGHVNASTKEAALAGGMSIVQAAWVTRAYRQLASGGKDSEQ